MYQSNLLLCPTVKFSLVLFLLLLLYFPQKIRSNNCRDSLKKGLLILLQSLRMTLTKSTVFENHQKCRIWFFRFWHFPPIFVLFKVTCLVTLFDRKLQVFKNSPKLAIFGIFNDLLSTWFDLNAARFTHNVEWDFFCDFQTPCP